MCARQVPWKRSQSDADARNFPLIASGNPPQLAANSALIGNSPCKLGKEYIKGLWSFVKGAGKKLIGKDDSPEEAINKELADLGLDAKDVDISVEGGKVVMKGKALDQETREKIILAAGNVDGIEEVEDAMEGSSEGTVFHTVGKGDTLSAIAQKTMGKASKYHAIFEANKPMLTHPDKIYPGQVLRIPTEA